MYELISWIRKQSFGFDTKIITFQIIIDKFMFGNLIILVAYNLQTYDVIQNKNTFMELNYTPTFSSSLFKYRYFFLYVHCGCSFIWSIKPWINVYVSYRTKTYIYLIPIYTTYIFITSLFYIFYVVS